MNNKLGVIVSLIGMVCAVLVKNFMAAGWALSTFFLWMAIIEQEKYD